MTKATEGNSSKRKLSFTYGPIPKHRKDSKKMYARYKCEVRKTKYKTKIKLKRHIKSEHEDPTRKNPYSDNQIKGQIKNADVAKSQMKGNDLEHENKTNDVKIEVKKNTKGIIHDCYKCKK